MDRERLNAEQAQGLRGVEHADIAEAAEVEEVAVAGDDERGSRGKCRGDDLIVVGIAHDARGLGGLGELDHVEVGGQDLGVGFADDGEALARGRPGEDIGELFEQDRAAVSRKRVMRRAY